MNTIIQLVAVAAIPVIVGGTYLTRMNRKKSVRWKQVKMSTIMSLVPVLVVGAIVATGAGQLGTILDGLIPG